MPKNIAFPYLMFTKFIDEPALKRLALFFDNIYVGEGGLKQILSVDPTALKEELKSLAHEKAVWELLIEKEIVITYPYIFDKFKNAESSEEGRYLIKAYEGTIPQSQSNTRKSITEQDKIAALNGFFLSHDISIRLDVLSLKEQVGSELYPFVRTHQSFQVQEKKKQHCSVSFE